MKDIDFDELDKAVNSLMATVGSPEQPTSSPLPETTSAATTVSAPADPSVVATTTPAVQATSPTSATTSETPGTSSSPSARPIAPAARRGGRFMDMVHASSDMTPSRTVSTPPSREGVSVRPPQEAAPASTSVDELSMVATPAPQSVAATPADMPDPLDLSEGNATPADDVVSTTQEDSPNLQPLAATEPTASLAPLESPFLADTKVEKRPLNAETSPASAPPMLDLTAELESENSAGDSDPQFDNQTRKDEPPLNPQVPELNSDLVAIEASDTVEVTQAIETRDAASQVPEPSAPLGATSIPQQYTAQESSGDKSHAAIYDASQYPEPVVHPATHRSGWWWVLWVVMLLAVGAGGALLLYYLGIIP